MSQSEKRDKFGKQAHMEKKEGTNTERGHIRRGGTHNIHGEGTTMENMEWGHIRRGGTYRIH